MPEVDRHAHTRNVYRRLADPAFRRRLTVEDSAGDRPVVNALRSDTMRYVLREIAAAGGAANVVVAMSDDQLMILGINAHRVDWRERALDPESGPFLDASCTVGAFIELLRFEAPSGHFVGRFVARGPEEQLNKGVAEVLSLF